MDSSGKNKDGKESLDEYMAELEKARRDLEQREENLIKTINLIGYALIYSDGDGRISDMNQLAQFLTEVSLEEGKGKRLDEAVSFCRIPSREPMGNPFDEVLREGQVVTGTGSCLMINGKGREYYVDYSAAPNLFQEDRIDGMILVLKDVTEQHTRQEQLGQIQKMDVVGQLAGGIAHDFNNMLGGILSAAELLRKRINSDPKSTEFCDIIINATGRAAELTQELVSFATKQRSTTSYMDIHRTVEDSVKILKGTIDPRISIKLNLHAAKSIIAGSPSQLQNVIVNLGTNAYHSMPAGGSFAIGSSLVEVTEEECRDEALPLVPGTYVQLDFTDTGCGIPPRLLKKIFEPFFTTKDKIKGTGLGLAAVYGIVKQHRGTIEVRSIVGQGTRFRIKLPLEQTESADFPSHSSDLIHGGGRIMVVDDEFIMRMTAKNILEELGYHVTLVENGRDAVNLFRAYKSDFDLILLDMIMPIMDGKDCFDELIRIDPKVKVILSTGLTGGDVIEEMRHQGLKGFIGKPYLSYELSQIVHKVISRP